MVATTMLAAEGVSYSLLPALIAVPVLTAVLIAAAARQPGRLHEAGGVGRIDHHRSHDDLPARGTSMPPTVVSSSSPSGTGSPSWG